MIPYRTPFFLPLLYPSLIWREQSDQKILFLTFDDGPVPGPTESVLHLLESYNAQATFFCIGDNVKKHPQILEQIVSSGHAIGNHTFNHLNGWRTSLKDYTKNIEMCEQFMPTSLGQTGIPKLFRPPYGRITRKQINALNNYKIIMWDVLSHDYDKSVTREKCLNRTVESCRPGSIVVFHDSLKAERNMLFALNGVLKEFSEQGYAFKSLQ
jgi:peptidoglycan-N-acetylglucosamine deacetylase